jgi:hypothetical protein
MTPQARQKLIIEFLDQQVKPLIDSRFNTEADQKRLHEIEEFIDKHCLPLLDTKGHDYTAGNAEKGEEPDALANFKEIANALQGRGVDKYDVWYVYFAKHLDALKTWLNDRRVRSEPLQGRIADLVNYLLILVALLEEDGL